MSCDSDVQNTVCEWYWNLTGTVVAGVPGPDTTGSCYGQTDEEMLLDRGNSVWSLLMKLTPLHHDSTVE